MLSLRLIEDADLDTIFQYQGDPESFEMATVRPKNWEDFSAHMARNRANPDSLIYTILDDQRVVGYIVSWVMEGERMFGYWIGREYWGMGYASGAVSHFLAEVPIRPLVAHVASTNIGSKRVLEKNGFRYVSVESVADEHFGNLELLKYQL